MDKPRSGKTTKKDRKVDVFLPPGVELVISTAGPKKPVRVPMVFELGKTRHITVYFKENG